MNDRCDALVGTNRREKSTIVWSLPLGTPDPKEGLQRWLYEALRRAIVSGRLPADSVLPGTRTLAQQYNLARGTVAAAYEQLLSEGYLVTRTGSGTRVSTVLPDPRHHAKPIPASLIAAHAGFARESHAPWIKRLRENDPPFPLSGANTLPQPFFPHRGDIRLFPIDLWRRLHVRQLRPSRLLTLNDTSPAGLPALRSAIAEHLAIARGVRVPPEQIVVTGSVQHALDLCMRLLTGPGDTVWMEDPGYVAARQIMHASGARVVDVAVDHDGLRVHDGIREAPSAALVYVTPTRHAPLGVPLSSERRAALLQWAAANGTIIFEDDYDSEYCFRSHPLPALRSLPGADQHVVLAGTFSKLMFPSLRVAYAVLPPRLVEPFVRAASLTVRSANGLTQAVLADFLGEGHFDRHVRRTRKIYASRAHAFERAAQKHWQELIDVQPAIAGLDVIGRLLSVDEHTAVQMLKAAGIDAPPLGQYTRRHRHPPGLVMGFAAFNEEEIDRAAQQVATVLREAT
ncbi:MocR-like pyridoxine biosynthesis transcription factor PdxR [Paraburkholderia azotifigens]|uniref:MocR-like pyridoxine biosynthesis transcription factor PdxR n=1 Tax=Paraburkholderia azotifigens TaxID=2057004 RepID=UPI0038BAB06C